MSVEIAKSMQLAVSKDSPFVHACGHQPCLTYLDGSVLKNVTWSDFTDRVEWLAAHLQTLPAGRIALVLKRTCAVQVAQAACHLAGRTFAPLDPTWPTWRLAKLVNAIESAAIIVDAGSAIPDQLKTSCATVVVDVLGNCLNGDEGASYTPVATPEIMYVMFTSGSTGEPKGVEVYSEGVFNYLEWKLKALNVCSADVSLIKTTTTFDVSIGEIWMPLVSGIVSHVLGDGLHLEADRVYEALALGGVTVCHFVPSVMALFLAQIESIKAEGNHSLPTLDKLRLIQCSGEALKTELRSQLSRVISPTLDLVNLYGPTEGTIEVTYFYCKDESTSHGFPLGHVPESVDIFITDVEDPTRVLPDGELGEICIGGIQVAKGYHGLEEETQKRFIVCPWPVSAGTRQVMYRTGDLGRRDPKNGWILYNGRFDRQVKVGGVRIELGEIESVVMRRFAAFLSTFVALFIDGQVIGVLVPKEGLPSSQIPSTVEISDAILSELPKAYNPNEWHTVQKSALPLSDAGKIDMKVLEKRVRNEQSVQVWAEVYDQLYDDNQTTAEEGADPTMDWASYKDSFNPASLHRRDVITEWVMEYVEMVLRESAASAGYERLARVCEMGCGKGMLVLKIAPRVSTVVCGDISKFAVAHVENTWAGYMAEHQMQGCNEQLHVTTCDATAFEKLPGAIESFNVIFCNGCSMYFPSFAYVTTFFDEAVARIDSALGGAVMLGDVRSIYHSPLFQLRRLMQVGRAPGAAREQAPGFARDDKDRTYDYRAFHALQHLQHLAPRVEAAEVQLKMGELDSEFTSYRFDVTYHIAKEEDQRVERKTLLVEEAAINKVDTAADVVASARQAMEAAGEAHAERVFAVLNVPNQRLLSDFMVASGQSEHMAFATRGVGVKPAELRAALASAFPDKHIVLTWSRAIGEQDVSMTINNADLVYMDVFVVPAHARAAKMAGLRGVSAFALAPHAALTAQLTQHRRHYERCISAIQAARSDKRNVSAEGAAKAAADAKALLKAGDVAAAVHTMVGWTLGHTLDAFSALLRESAATVTFEELGGNSFMAMKLIQQMRCALGAAPPVFKLLTQPVASFVSDAISAIRSLLEGGGEGEWCVEAAVPGMAEEGAEGGSDRRPVLVMFPAAGDSIKAYAKVYSELVTMAEQLPAAGVRVLLVQPPGRDARGGESNLRDFTAMVERCVRALAKALRLEELGGVARDCIFVGDSLGSLTCWIVAHRLRELFPSFCPVHFVVSGNPSPNIASSQWGLGTFATQSIHDESDEDLLAFVKKGLAAAQEARGGGGANLASATEVEKMKDMEEVLDALRCDCIMYEAFRRPAAYGMLPADATMCRGELDPFNGPDDVWQWAEEFGGRKEQVVVPRAAHHIYTENAPAMASVLLGALVRCGGGISADKK